MYKLVLIMMMFLAGCAGKEQSKSDENVKWKCQSMGGLLDLSQRCVAVTDKPIQKKKIAQKVSPVEKLRVKQEEVKPSNLLAARLAALKERRAAEQAKQAAKPAVEVAKAKPVVKSVHDQLMALPPKQYVVQVGSMLYKESLDKFISSNKLFEKMHVRTRVKGKDWYVVVFGVYHGFSEAKRILAQVPARYKGQSWIRTTGSLQESMRKYDNHQKN